MRTVKSSTCLHRKQSKARHKASHQHAAGRPYSASISVEILLHSVHHWCLHRPKKSRKSAAHDPNCKSRVYQGGVEALQASEQAMGDNTNRESDIAANMQSFMSHANTPLNSACKRTRQISDPWGPIDTHIAIHLNFCVEFIACAHIKSLTPRQGLPAYRIPF